MMFEAVFHLCIFLPYISGLIMPLTKSDGSVNLTSILSHITLLEQTVDTLHNDTAMLQIDLRTTNEKLQLTQAELNITRQELQTSSTDLQATRTDLLVTKDKLQHAQTDLLSLKNDMAILRTEMGIVKSKVENTGPDFHPWNLTLNDSLLISFNGSFTDLEALNLDVQSLNNDLNTTTHMISEVQTDINSFKKNVSSELKNVTEECLALKSESHLFNSLQSDIVAMDKKLSFLNRTVHEVQSEARQAAANMSSVVQLVDQKQLVENMGTQSLKTLAQNTSAQLKQFEKNVNSTDASMTAELNYLETDVNSTSGFIQNVQQDLLSLKSDLNTTREDITVTNSEVNALKKNISDVQKLSAETKQALELLAKTLASKTRAVAFQAYVSSTHNVTSLHPLVYDSIINNFGSGYNNTTGRFTAPVNGIYMFWTELYIHSDYQIPSMSMKKSGMSIGSGWSASTSKDDESVVSATCVSHLQKGEEVWVQFEKFAWFVTTVFVASGGNDTMPKSFFGGALLTLD